MGVLVVLVVATGGKQSQFLVPRLKSGLWTLDCCLTISWNPIFPDIINIFKFWALTDPNDMHENSARLLYSDSNIAIFTSGSIVSTLLRGITNISGVFNYLKNPKFPQNISKSWMAQFWYLHLSETWMEHPPNKNPTKRKAPENCIVCCEGLFVKIWDLKPIFITFICCKNIYNSITCRMFCTKLRTLI